MLPYKTDIDSTRKWGSLSVSSMFFLSLWLVFPQKLSASHPLEAMCPTQEKPLEYWVNDAEKLNGINMIIVGVAENVRPELNYDSTYYAPYCRATFIVKEAIKGKWIHEIEVLTEFNNDKTDEDLKNLKYCPFKKGEVYVVFGANRINENNVPSLPKQFISTKYDKNFNCPPNQKLDKFNSQKLLNKIRTLIKKGN
jgi:hypothetical protein